MIRKIAKILNNRILLQSRNHFVGEKETQPTTHNVDDTQTLQNVQPQQALQQLQSEFVEARQEVVVDPQVRSPKYLDQDPYQGITLLDSNWKQLAPFVHTNFYINKNSQGLQEQVKKKLKEMEALLGFDIGNLDRIKILAQRQFDLKKSIYMVSNDANRYLQNDVSSDTTIGYNLMSSKKLKNMIETRNMVAFIQNYKNNEFQNFSIQSELLTKIVDSVISSNFKNEYFLNLFEYFRISQRQMPLKVNKNIEKIIHNINNFTEVNKLKFIWSMNNVFEDGINLIDFSLANHQLAKVSFQGIQYSQSQKILRGIYNTFLGKDAMKKLIAYSIQRFSTQFNEFLAFWGLFNLLISKLTSLNQVSISSPNSLNTIFHLFELNVSGPKQILTQMIPQILNETKNKSMYEIYRVHAKSWLQRKVINKNAILSGPFDEFTNRKVDLQEEILIGYNGWKSLNASKSQVSIRTRQTAKKYNQRNNQLLSQVQTIDHLIKGDYNFVLNHFLLTFNSGLDSTAYNQIRKINKHAQQKQFTDENSKAIYILKQIKSRLQYMAVPVSFKQQFLNQNYKTIKWMDRSKQESRNKLQGKRQYLQDTSYSRKRESKYDHDDQHSTVDNERIRSKPKQNPQGLFKKKNKALFSTQKDSYTQYRQIVKQVTQTADSSLVLKLSEDINNFKTQIQSKSKQVNEFNQKSIISQQNLPVVGNGVNLLKYLFLKNPSQQRNPDQRIKKKLKVSFISQIGALEKDYSQYLKNNRFGFPLAQDVYISLLEDQVTKYTRKTFKTIVSHMIAFRNSLSDKEIQLICQISRKNRIGITLVEIFNLMILNKVVISKQSVYKIDQTLQKFKKINMDIFLMTKKYCQSVQMPFEIKMLSSYVKSLLFEEEDQKLAQLCQMIKNQLKPKPYKLKLNISADENLKLQKQYKQFQKKQYNKILYEIIDMAVLNVNNKLPVYIAELFDEYTKSQIKLEAKQIAISLIVYCNNIEKFLQIIRDLKANPQKIVLMTYECALKAARLNPKGLESNAQQMFNISLFTHNFMLTQDQIQRSVGIFKTLNSPTVFIKFLQYMLRYNPPVNHQIKSGMYFIMNNINDDFAKNTISGLLDFIFNNNRQKERQQYRKAQMIEEEKVRLLQQLENKKPQENINLQNTNLQNILVQQTQNKQAKNKKKKADNKVQAKVQTKAEKLKKIQQNKKPKTEKVKRFNPNQDQQVFLASQSNSDGYLRKSNTKNKLRTKSLTNFQQIFTKREDVSEQIVSKKEVSKKAGSKSTKKQQK